VHGYNYSFTNEAMDRLITKVGVVCTVFNEHKACLLRMGEREPALTEAIKQQCRTNATPTVSHCP